MGKEVINLQNICLLNAHQELNGYVDMLLGLKELQKHNKALALIYDELINNMQQVLGRIDCVCNKTNFADTDNGKKEDFEKLRDLLSIWVANRYLNADEGFVSDFKYKFERLAEGIFGVDLSQDEDN